MSGYVDSIGEMEKWEGMEKGRDRRDFSFLSFMFGWENKKSRGMTNSFIWLRRKVSG